MTALWLGVPIPDGVEVPFPAAQIGPLNLWRTRAGWSVTLAVAGMHIGVRVVDWCRLSEVDARTREWIRSIAALGTAKLPVVPASQEPWELPDRDFRIRVSVGSKRWCYCKTEEDAQDFARQCSGVGTEIEMLSAALSAREQKTGER